MQGHPAFTIIELLVVVTIVVVLLALLTPAMDRAIYSAELAACGANLRSIGSGATSYALDNNRFFPYRAPAHSNTGNKGAYHLCDTNSDDRPRLRPYMPINALADPLAGKVDLNSPPKSTAVFAAYSLWFGFGYISQNISGVNTQGTPGEKIMRKLGDSLTWQGERYSVLAGDFDLIATQHNLTHGSHPDSIHETGLTSLTTHNDSVAAYSWWDSFAGYRRGPIDTNYVHQDGSVSRLLRVTWNEGEDPASPGEPGERVARAPEYPLGQGYVEGRWVHIPVR